jgi:uncharacterized membrane protein YbhN (UPF0104 family)
MAPATKKWLKFFLRWGVAVLGVWFVVKNISLHDTVRVQDPTDGRPVTVRLAEPATNDNVAFQVEWPDADGNITKRTLSRSELIARSQYERVTILAADGSKRKVDVLGLKVPADPKVGVGHWPLLVSEPRSLIQKFLGTYSGPVFTVAPARVTGGYSHDLLNYPLVDDGLINIVRKADRSFLWMALLIFPINYVITAVRWKLLLDVLQIRLGAPRAFQINMVGAFYNTFMPGSTGGDLLRAYYAAKHTTHKGRAVLSVVVDRVIGLLALILLGGTMAAIKWLSSVNPHDPVTQKCRQVAIGSGLLLGLTVLGLLVYYAPLLRRATGLDFVLRKLPMQKHVQGLLDVMDLYGRRPGVVLFALLMSLPVHAIAVLSAMAAGQAFGLPIHPGYYWIVVPVVALAGAIPVSPQGAGVMEFFAYLLMRGQKATVADALVLTMSIRFVQIFWNLLAGVFLLRGSYHAPTTKEAEELASTEDDSDGGAAMVVKV